MSIITIFSGDFCNKKKIIEKILDDTGYKLIKDSHIIEKTNAISDMSKSKIKNAFSSKISMFNKFTHEKERAIAWLKLAMAQTISEDNLLIDGFSGHLMPKEISHTLKICLIAKMNKRIDFAQKKEINAKEATSIIIKKDSIKSAWTNTLFDVLDPWSHSLYDIVIPTDKMEIAEIIELIGKNLISDVIKPTTSSKKATKDFVLSANIEVALAKEGHSALVKSRDGFVTLTINKHVLMLARLEEELKSIVEKIEGVKSIETRVGKGYYQTDIYRKYDFELPKILLVDDEREFVKTLSERLFMRDMGSATAYDGESALDMIDEEKPDVMILDLKMPGIDGIEVLKKVKKDKPEIEVIILTGHGSEIDEKKCMELGAFAYLQKPVDIDILSKTIKKAKKKMSAYEN